MPGRMHTGHSRTAAFGWWGHGRRWAGPDSVARLLPWQVTCGRGIFRRLKHPQAWRATASPARRFHATDRLFLPNAHFHSALPPSVRGRRAGRYGHLWGGLLQADLGGAAGSVQITAGRRVVAILLAGGSSPSASARYSGTGSACTCFLKDSGK